MKEKCCSNCTCGPHCLEKFEGIEVPCVCACGCERCSPCCMKTNNQIS